MLESMTGYGFAQISRPKLAVSVELRSVNNRHLKINVRGSSPYPLHEYAFEKLIRQQVLRGTIQVQVQVTREVAGSALQLNTATMLAYIEQLRLALEATQQSQLLPGFMSGVLALPGIAPESTQTNNLPEDEWPVVEEALTEALKKLRESRRTEGAAMAVELRSLQTIIATELQSVRDYGPKVAATHRDRLLERVRSALGETGVNLKPDDIIREVTLFADRTDVHEEIARLTAHLQQFGELITQSSKDGAGRRLEFVVQEMGREVNTLGSKAADATISRHVVEMKAALEKIREMIQNVE